MCTLSTTETMCTTRLNLVSSSQTQQHETAEHTADMYRKQVSTCRLKVPRWLWQLQAAGSVAKFSSRHSLAYHCDIAIDGRPFLLSLLPLLKFAACASEISQSQGHGAATPDPRHRFAGGRCELSLSEYPIAFCCQEAAG